MDTAFLRQVEGFSLTTAEILYRLPDHPRLLQSYIWQDYDLAPRFPKLTDFLDFWAANLDGALFRIRVAHRRLIAPAEFSFVERRAQAELSRRADRHSGRDDRHVDAMHGAALREIGFIAGIERVDIVAGAVRGPAALVGEDDAPAAPRQKRKAAA